MIATCLPAATGGRPTGSTAVEVELLLLAALRRAVARAPDRDLRELEHLRFLVLPVLRLSTSTRSSARWGSSTPSGTRPPRTRSTAPRPSAIADELARPETDTKRSLSGVAQADVVVVLKLGDLRVVVAREEPKAAVEVVPCVTSVCAVVRRVRRSSASSGGRSTLKLCGGIVSRISIVEGEIPQTPRRGSSVGRAHG